MLLGVLVQRRTFAANPVEKDPDLLTGHGHQLWVVRRSTLLTGTIAHSRPTVTNAVIWKMLSANEQYESSDQEGQDGELT